MNVVNYSVIIPHKNSLSTLFRLIKSIPSRSDIEVIVVDNSTVGINMQDIGVDDRKIKLLHSSPSRFAGGARNLGIEYASGEWLVFADADDFFLEGAFDIFDKYKSEIVDIVYFKPYSVYDDTLQSCDRHIPFVQSIEKFTHKEISDIEFKLSFVVPWAKIIKKSFVEHYNIRYDEVLAANDVMFSVQTAYYSKDFLVSEDEVYVVTMRRGSLSQRWDYQIVNSRYRVTLRKNLFLKEHGLAKYQSSVMIYFFKSFSLGFNVFIEFFKLALHYKQNIFIGWRVWIKSFFNFVRNQRKNKKYIVN